MSVKLESKRVTPGCYHVTVYRPASPKNGLPHRGIIAVYSVFEVETDIAGYGHEWTWRVGANRGTSEPGFDPFYTKAEALAAIRVLHSAE